MNSNFDFASLAPSFVGGILIGLAALILMSTHGRIMGISGITSRLLKPVTGDIDWRISFLAGLLLTPIVLGFTTELDMQVITDVSTPALILAGLLVGFGTVYGNGCTSGHGVCGVSRLSKRSLVATLTFLATAMVTATAFRLVWGS
jgi:uncharacterized membrane protein YedE/YeeE